MADVVDGRPVLSKELKFDGELLLTNKDFKNIIADSVKSITTHEEKLAKLNKLLEQPIAFPNNYVLATIASRVHKVEKLLKDEDVHGQKVYTDSKIGNWRLLTAGYDPRSLSTNGYCGAAYWNPDTQQVIIAHSGTKNMGGFYNDFYGAFKNEHVPQIDSAVTFTDSIVSVLEEINKEKGSDIQLFFTGHSLGAWLACITAFSAKFLRRNEDDCFVSNLHSEDSGYHSSTIIFDGPGCEEMLKRIQNRLMDRYSPCLIASLDITNYLSAPHFINACNHQVGDVYRLFIDLNEHKEQLESLRNETNPLKKSFQKLVKNVYN